MATKQLNALNPRNFKEKIELLKKKEAASTANFAAAIRDAREICQIAGACDPILKPSLGSSLIDRTSLPKAYSLPSVSSPASLRTDAKADSIGGFNEQFSINQKCPPRAQSTIVSGATATELRHPPSGISAQALQPTATPRAQANSNERLSTLLSSPVHTHTAPGTSHPWRFDQPVSSGISTPHPPLVTPTPRPNGMYSRSQTDVAIPSTVNLMTSRMVCQANSSSVTPWQMAHPVNGIRTATSHTTLCSVHSSTATPAAFGRTSDYNLPANTVYDTLQTYRRLHSNEGVMRQHSNPGQPSSRSMYNIPNCSGHWNVSSPYYSVEAIPSGTSTVAATATTSVYLDLSSPPSRIHPDSRERLYERSFSKGPDISYTLATPHPVCGPEWRRVSSDSSIRQSLSVSGQSGCVDVYTCQGGSSLHSNPPYLQQQPFSNPVVDRKPDTLRRRFPTEPTVGSAPAFASSIVTAQQHQLSTASVPEMDYPLPPKRAFAGSTTVDANCGLLAPNRDCSRVGLNSVVDNSSSCAERRPVPCLAPLHPLPHNHSVLNCNTAATTSRDPFAFTQPNSRAAVPQQADVIQRLSTVFSVSAPNIHIEHRDAISSVLPTTTIATTLTTDPSLGTDLSSCDPADLDRFLQLPPAFLDPQSDSNWPGRRDSCTMAAEVLSALNTADEDIPTSVALSAKGGLSVVSDNSLPAANYSKVSSSAYPCSLPNPPVANTGSVGYAPNSELRSSSSFLDVANKLGISITSNDYQLLTDPQLANYVTDETTEAQLLR
ncbi:hypothetical protein CSKR_202101 [Clonorchis sinensis]|uniref:Transducer of regulated CREB activity N-terminal domain-containing protein n=1 Tax=Clonorchis sinensis TaxID=79923 RepID=A0A8T1LX19_CLOSI|nr:hypothetical protein CSKR_202101 [Clonorchis sinensis]